MTETSVSSEQMYSVVYFTVKCIDIPDAVEMRDIGRNALNKLLAKQKTKWKREQKKNDKRSTTSSR